MSSKKEPIISCNYGVCWISTTVMALGDKIFIFHKILDIGFFLHCISYAVISITGYKIINWY